MVNEKIYIILVNSTVSNMRVGQSFGQVKCSWVKFFTFSFFGKVNYSEKSCVNTKKTVIIKYKLLHYP